MINTIEVFHIIRHRSVGIERTAWEVELRLVTLETDYVLVFELVEVYNPFKPIIVNPTYCLSTLKAYKMLTLLDLALKLVITASSAHFTNVFFYLHHPLYYR